MYPCRLYHSQIQRQKRKQERTEKKQRKAQQHHQPQPDQAPSSTGGKRLREESGGSGINGSKRPRAEMQQQQQEQAPLPSQERKSLGLVARAKAAREVTGLQHKGREQKAGKKKAVVERPKDPFLLAEEEELKYLERKLGLAGALPLGLHACIYIHTP